VSSGGIEHAVIYYNFEMIIIYTNEEYFTNYSLKIGSITLPPSGRVMFHI